MKDAQSSRHRVNIRLSHPNLYRSIMTFSLIYVGLGINFLLTMPTFNPYQIPYDLIGLIFLTLGVLKIVLVNFIRDLVWLRRVMAAEIMVSLWWGIGASITYFRGQTSLQLPILYAGLSILEVFLLLEPFVNPMTKEGPKNS